LSVGGALDRRVIAGRSWKFQGRWRKSGGGRNGESREVPDEIPPAELVEKWRKKAEHFLPPISPREAAADVHDG